MKYLMAITLVAGLLAGACGGDDDAPAAPGNVSPDGSAKDAVTHLLDQVNKGQWGPEWDTLHPAQQALVPRDLYITCADKSSIPDFTAKTTDSYEEDVTIPGTNEKAHSTAVTVEIKSRSDTSKDTFHVFNVDGKWRWTLADPSGYANGNCPS